MEDNSSKVPIFDQNPAIMDVNVVTEGKTFLSEHAL